MTSEIDDTDRDHATDYDVLDATYRNEPHPIWDGLRATCPIAHTERHGGSWLPTRYHDVVAIAHDVERFSSTQPSVLPGKGDGGGFAALAYGLPPISADPPLHTWTRRILLPWFSHTRVDSFVETTRAHCQELIDGFIDGGECDAAQEYARHIPVRVIARVLGVPLEMSDTFTTWVRAILDPSGDHGGRSGAANELLEFFVDHLAERRKEPGDDLLSSLLTTAVDGDPIADEMALGMAAMVLIAGVDTTWSSIGSSLWHLATHPADRGRLAAQPELIPTAVEELLRAYSPVTMARVVTEDLEFGGCPMAAGDRVLMNFPGANRDPEVFAEPDRVLLDRTVNRHLAFGVGIHRCAGSNLARMEIRVALEEWLKRIPEFSLARDADVTWSGGQVRGPRTVPVVFAPHDGHLDVGDAGAPTGRRGRHA